MFSGFRYSWKQTTSKLARAFKFTSHCDSDISLVDEADAALKEDKPKIKTPMQYLELNDVLSRGNVHTFDGLRVQVQKQLNLNTVVSHFYWIGSQATGAPIYMYRVILPFDDKMANFATDMDFNIEGEVKTPLTDNIALKAETVVNDQQKTGKLSFNRTDESSASQLQVGKEESTFASVSYMQSLTPHLILGGRGKYTFEDGSATMAFGGVYDKDENQVVMRLAGNSIFNIMYQRRVNPNRVNLFSQLTYDLKKQSSQMSLSAEYQLKQSKLQMSVDSALTIKSTLETTISPGVTFQLAGEVSQLTDTYRFGYAISMG